MHFKSGLVVARPLLINYDHNHVQCLAHCVLVQTLLTVVNFMVTALPYGTITVFFF